MLTPKNFCGIERREMTPQTSASPTAPAGPGPAQWVLPFVDQPIEFWQAIAADYPGLVREVYFPMPGGAIGSGEPPQPATHLEELLRRAPLPCSVLLNALTLPRPVEQIAPPVIEALKRLIGEYGLAGATVTNLNLAMRVREALPDLPLTASCLMQIALPSQVAMIAGIIDTIVPDIRIVRDLPALITLRQAFSGRIRLMVNESCLPGCPFRIQHFHEMGNGFPYPLSLCEELLARQPWMRLTTGWILPQHLHLYAGTYDELKIAGRVTLRDPVHYRLVLDSYIQGRPLAPGDIGGGPASVLADIEITEAFFARTLTCGHRCHECSLCRDYYAAAMRQPPSDRGTPRPGPNPAPLP